MSLFVLFVFVFVWWVILFRRRQWWVARKSGGLVAPSDVAQAQPRRGGFLKWACVFGYSFNDCHKRERVGEIDKEIERDKQHKNNNRPFNSNSCKKTKYTQIKQNWKQIPSSHQRQLRGRRTRRPRRPPGSACSKHAQAGGGGWGTRPTYTPFPFFVGILWGFCGGWTENNIFFCFNQTKPQINN